MSVRKSISALRRQRAVAAAIILVSLTGGAFAMPNLPFPTLGGKQVWADRYLHAGWRIQENVFTGHARLLDPANVRRCWGRIETCRKRFDKLRAERNIASYRGHLVLLVHGLGRSRASFSGLEAALREAGYQVAGVEYPSTRRSLAANADSLEELISALDGVDRISFVTHSLGGLVVRELLSRDAGWRERITVNAVVMTAPPSRGSALADTLVHVPPVNWILGPGLVAATTGATRDLPIPDAPFAIIAAGRGDSRGYNPWLAGDDDMLVAVEETRLAGADSWIRVDGAHTFVMNHPDSIRAVKTFLEGRQF